MRWYRRGLFADITKDRSGEVVLVSNDTRSATNAAGNVIYNMDNVSRFWIDSNC